MAQPITPLPRQKTGKGFGPWIRILLPFFLLCLIIGSLWIGINLFKTVMEELGPYSWKKVECRILTKEVKSTERGYFVEISYGYAFDGREYTSGHYRGSTDISYGKANSKTAACEAGGSGTCFVDSRNPVKSSLTRRLPWTAAALPPLFLPVFLGGIWLRSIFLAKTGKIEGGRTSLLAPQHPGLGARWLLLLFPLIGIGIAHSQFLKPLVRTMDSERWVKSPCSIVASSIIVEEGDESITYIPNILYSYQVSGKEYRSNRYAISGSSSSKRGRVETIVDCHPVGLITTCYVNPENPHDATLNRGFSSRLNNIFFPILFAIFGSAALYWSLKGSASFHLHTSGPLRGQTELKISPYAAARFLLASAITVFYSFLICYPLVLSTKKSMTTLFDTGGGALFLTSSLLLVGIGILAFTTWSYSRTTFPRLRIFLDTYPIEPGKNTGLSWKAEGDASAILRLKFALIGREEATYSKGSSSSTDKWIFSTYQVATLSKPADCAAGKAGLRLPPDTMHSFNSAHNRIAWELHIEAVTGDNRQIREELEITVLPAKVSEERP